MSNGAKAFVALWFLLIVVLFSLFMYFSQQAAEHHDNEVRRQTLETCKEFK